MRENKCLVQGYRGCYHEMAMHQIFDKSSFVAVACDSFQRLAEGLMEDEAPVAVMAIENSIAGSILQNYRILRENKLQIIGETYLRIKHQLMALPGQSLDELTEVVSHPMALNQCLDFLQAHPGMERKEYSDTALAAMDISSNHRLGSAAIASSLAAELYGLDILAKDIESDENNYTRFFILQKRQSREQSLQPYDKASIYLRLKHEPGSLLVVLECVRDLHLNLSKLQSFPVLGAPGEYYFFLDLEFERSDKYYVFIKTITPKVLACEELGIYQRANLND